MHPLMIQAIAADQDRAMREQAAAWRRSRQSHRTSAGRRHGWLRWPAAGRGPASRTARQPRRASRAA
jgi:hypothetical protein